MSSDHRREFAKGTVLFRQGERGRDLYIIQSGAVEIVRQIGPTRTLLATLGSGEFVGEMAIINHAPRSATATVVEDAQMVVVDARTFGLMVKDNSEVAIRFIRQLAERLGEADRRIEALLFRDPIGRVAHWLLLEALTLASAKGDSGSLIETGLEFDLGSREPLGKWLGLSAEEVVSVLSELESAEMISRASGSMLLLYPEKLALHQTAE